MKKVFKRILLGLGVIILLFIIAALSYTFKAKSEINKMTPVETGEIANGIIALKDGFSNIYFIKSKEKYIAIDAGNSPENIQLEMNRLGISPSEIVAVFLTHSDGDHIAGLELFNRARLYMSKAEEQMINGTTPRFLFIKNPPIPYNFKYLENYQTLDILGLKIQGILVPGHTPGSMSYLINEKYLFTGDNISLIDEKAELFTDFFNMDSELQSSSLHLIADLDNVEYIFTAHHGYTDQYESAMEKWKK